MADTRRVRPLSLSICAAAAAAAAAAATAASPLTPATSFLTLPALTTTDNNAHPKVSITTLIVIATASLATGFSLSALVVFATSKNAFFHLTHVFKPAISSCSLGFLAHILTVALSTSYSLDSPAGIFGAVLGVVSTLIYTMCAIHSSSASAKATRPIHLRDSSSTQLPLAHYRSQSASSYSMVPERNPSSGSNQTHWSGYNMSNTQIQPAPYLGQYQRSDVGHQLEQPTQLAQPAHFPLAASSRHASPSRPPAHLQTDVQPKGAFDTGSPIGPVHILPKGSTAQGYAGGNLVEAELTRQQMLNLLTARQGQGGFASSQATFRIELPKDELDRAGSIFGPERIDLASPAVAAQRERLRATSLGKEQSVVRTQGITITQSPPPPLTQSDTVKSRDDRRREIELGHR